MVSVSHALPDSGVDAATVDKLIAGVPEEGATKLREALDFAAQCYGDAKLGSGEAALSHGLGAALILAGLNLDLDTRLAALLFAIPDFVERAREKIAGRWGEPVALL
ncbi:MAG: HD domain-containing protein, partial [Rhodocyclaceae bacterium]